MRFEEVIQRITGLSTPVFGVSWNPPEAEVAVARRIIAFLEDRRVLYNPSELEIPGHCVQSVLEIREFLTSELSDLQPDRELTKSIRAMRSACRKFLNTIHDPEDRITRFGSQLNHWASWVFNSALGEMRGVFGVHIARIASQHGLDVEDQLASILPGADAV